MEGERGSDLHLEVSLWQQGIPQGRGRRDWSGQTDKEAFALIQAKDQRTPKSEREADLKDI